MTIYTVETTIVFDEPVDEDYWDLDAYRDFDTLDEALNYALSCPSYMKVKVTKDDTPG